MIVTCVDVRELLFIAEDVDELMEHLQDCGCWGAGADRRCNSCVAARNKKSRLQNQLFKGLEALSPEERERYRALRRRQKQAREEDELYDEAFKALKQLISD